MAKTRWLKLTSWFFITLSILIAQTKTGSVNGVITNERGEAVRDANVILNGTAYGATTSGEGKFSLSNVPFAKYTLTVRHVGYEQKTIEMEVRKESVVNLSIVLKESAIEFSPIVVSGTRTERELSNDPIPTSVVMKKDLSAANAIRLNDVLSEQTGLMLTNNHGTGVQMQGFDADYTLILLDGEPVIGRTAGTLQLSRLYVADIKQIEIVKGPSSALYGSEALAGVINLITDKPMNPFSAALRGRYASFNQYDFYGNIATQGNDIGLSLGIQRSGSDGYSLTQTSVSQTSPRYTSTAFMPKVQWALGSSDDIALSSRIAFESQKNTATSPSDTLLSDKYSVLDWNIGLQYTHRFESAAHLKTKLYATRYRTEDVLTYPQSGILYEQGIFDQTLYKGEVEFQIVLNSTYIITAGGGYIGESVMADRIAGGTRNARNLFAYGQNEWMPNEVFDLILSYRYDVHSDYNAHFSPKASLLVKPASWVSVRTSVGGGFKAPTFQQLYLDFTNPQVGYSVFGVTNAVASLQKLRERGEIAEIFSIPSALGNIRPEQSLAFNGGIEFLPLSGFSLKVNLFRNNVTDLIETLPIARKTNGQSVFSYFNLNKIYTQGLEAEMRVAVAKGLTVTLGYQYLEAKDVDVLDAIHAGKIFKVGNNGVPRAVQEVEYGGLFDRSPHSGVLRIVYEELSRGHTSSLRITARDRYGFGDVNGNLILDDDREYVPGYVIVNYAGSQRLWSEVSLQFGVENIFDVTKPQYIPSLPGRVFFAGVAAEFH